MTAELELSCRQFGSYLGKRLHSDRRCCLQLLYALTCKNANVFSLSLRPNAYPAALDGNAALGQQAEGRWVGLAFGLEDATG